jgi:tetratricopeptide (TPR) repeat protein
MTRAISLNPNDADVLAVSSYINAVCGHLQLALQHMDMALERNPYSPPWYQWLRGLTFYLSGRFDDAFAALILYGQPNANVLKWRTLCLVRLERISEARANMLALLAIKPDFSVTEARKFYEHLPDIESHIELLRQAGLPECMMLNTSPLSHELETDDRKGEKVNNNGRILEDVSGQEPSSAG